MVLGLPTGVVLVYLHVLVTVALFISEVVPPDVTAIGVVVALALLSPWTGVGLGVALSDFSNPATLTVLATYVLSRGVQNTGAVRRLGVALAATFAGSTAFMTPVGYQTNLMVYSPGGYRFTDYVRVGAPVQLLLAVVTTVGIALIWGVMPPTPA